MQRLVLVVVVVLAPFLTVSASAQPRTTEGSSILFFPNLVADETQDAVVQITNLSSTLLRVRCFYVSPTLGVSDFAIYLLKEQPTQWMVSRGRTLDPDDDCLSEGGVFGDCSGAGVDPGVVPPLPLGFRGQLLCVETDASANPIGGNHLRGQATIIGRRAGGVGKYSAVGFQGSELAGATGNVLRLEGKLGEPKGQYSACPESWILSHQTDVRENGTLRHTCVTVAACSIDLETEVPETVQLLLVATNDLEETFTASTTITSWAEICLSDLDDRFFADVSGVNHVQTRIESAAESSGIVVVAETLRSGDEQLEQTSSAVNVPSQGTRSNPDVIALPDSVKVPLK